ncbi:cyclin-like protein [Mucidula mucida]|nr:cyclin-like protein [Mucidula mucida]
MATDFWASSHYKRWLVDRSTLRQARADDLQYVDDPEHLEFLGIYFSNAIAKLGKKLQLRQRAIATATVFFRRFYLKNSYCETDPFLVISACIYVAAKAEESPVHIKNVVTESRSLFSHQYNVKHFPSDNSKLAEVEFYLVDDLECDLTIFHPYRTLMALCKKESAAHDNEETEAGELGVGVDSDDLHFDEKLEMSESALQMAWSIINDSYRSNLCLLYPPHLVAPQPRRSSRTHIEQKKSQDPIAFLADLNVSLPLIATISQEILSLYALWDRYKDDNLPDATVSARPSPASSSNKSASHAGTPRSVQDNADGVTPTFLGALVMKMREGRLSDISHPPTARPAAVNKMLERAQAAG